MHIEQKFHGVLTRLTNALKHLINATILLVQEKGLIFTLLILVFIIHIMNLKAEQTILGRDPMDDYLGTDQEGLDCDGHGTHVASIAAGKTYGAAKKANLYSVRALDCSGWGPWSVIMAGMSHAAQRANETGRPSIISMSLSGGYTESVDNLVTAIVQSNISIIVAAGNKRNYACNYSPASNSLAITVGGSREGGGMYYWSNGGSCVDIIAPALNVSGAGILCNNCTLQMSGTSIATPLVTGVAAIHLEREPYLTPEQLKHKLLNESCRDILDFDDYNVWLKISTPNRLLHITGNCGGQYYVTINESEEIVSPGYPDNYPDSVECIYKLISDNETIVQLTLNEFETHDSFDYLEIIDGDYEKQISKIAIVSGGLPSVQAYQSSINAMTLRFVSNSNDNKKGFRAHFDSQPKAINATSTIKSTASVTVNNITQSTSAIGKTQSTSATGKTQSTSATRKTQSTSAIGMTQSTSAIGKTQSTSAIEKTQSTSAIGMTPQVTTDLPEQTPSGTQSDKSRLSLSIILLLIFISCFLTIF